VRAIPRTQHTPEAERRMHAVRCATAAHKEPERQAQPSGGAGSGCGGTPLQLDDGAAAHITAHERRQRALRIALEHRTAV
jgi:hypothetical protein